MPKKFKKRETMAEILASCSESMFPADHGNAPVTLDSRDVEGDTPLHVMMWRNNTYGALQLIAAGADVNAVGDMSETPLHVAVRQQNATVLEALLNAGADTSCVSEFGQSPRDLGEEAGRKIKQLFGNT